MTSATERLRALLDERGVEWSDDGYPTTCTVWASDGIVWHGLWRDDCIELIAHLTPAQAVDATLGRGTCHIDLVGYDEREDRFQCRSCDWSMSVRRGTWPRFNYCSNCGRKVVE